MVNLSKDRFYSYELYWIVLNCIHISFYLITIVVNIMDLLYVVYTWKWLTIQKTQRLWRDKSRPGVGCFSNGVPCKAECDHAGKQGLQMFAKQMGPWTPKDESVTLRTLTFTGKPGKPNIRCCSMTAAFEDHGLNEMDASCHDVRFSSCHGYGPSTCWSLIPTPNGHKPCIEKVLLMALWLWLGMTRNGVWKIVAHLERAKMFIPKSSQHMQ